MRKQGKINNNLKLFIMYKSISTEDANELKDMGFDQLIQKPVKYIDVEKLIQWN